MGHHAPPYEPLQNSCIIKQYPRAKTKISGLFCPDYQRIYFMLMSLFRWQAKILNKLYQTERYNKLVDLQINNPQSIDYQCFYQLTPNSQPRKEVITCANLLCRPLTSAASMQQQVNFLNKYIGELPAENYNIEHVLIYSTLSKCRIWPKVLKSGQGFVPELINFYNQFTKKYNEFLDFKFDPIILSQKYTKIMNKVNTRKKDHPQLAKAIKNSNQQSLIQLVQQLRAELQIQNKQTECKVEEKVADHMNNILHENKGLVHHAVIHSTLQIIQYLYKLGLDFQVLDDEQQTPIFYAIKRNDLKIIGFLVEVVKININHREYQSRTPLYLAAFEGYIEVVDYLISKGADPQLCSKLDRTPLSKACYLGNANVVRYLLSKKVDMLKRDNKGRTALHNAVWGIEGGRDGKRRGHIVLEDSPQCTELLLEAGHPIEFEDYDGFTPLFSAISSRAIRSVRLLRKYGANFNHHTKKHQSSVFIAAKYGHLPVLKLLIEQYGCDFMDRDVHGYTPLCASITLEQPFSFRYLCDKHLQIKQPLQIKLLLHCCHQYEALNFSYILDWVMDSPPQLVSKKVELLLMDIKDMALILDQIQTKNGYDVLLPAEEKDRESQSNSTDWDNRMPEDYPGKKKYLKQNSLSKNKLEANKGRILFTLLSMTDLMVKHHPEVIVQEEISQLLQECVKFFNKQKSIIPEGFAQAMISLSRSSKQFLDGIRISHHHSDRQIMALICSLQTSLTIDVQALSKTMKVLCRLRKTAVIINLFNNAISQPQSAFSILRKEILLQIITEKTEDELSMIEYCICNGAEDIAVYLKSIASQEMNSSLASIPSYELTQRMLEQKQTCFSVEAVEAWAVNFQAVLERITPLERQKYHKVIAQTQNQHPRFASSGHYSMVDTQEKLAQLRVLAAKSTLIGIDVEHFNQSKEHYFACSIQVAVSEGVYLLDPLAEVEGKDLSKENISNFLREIFAEQNKIKILHAYENDLKWIQEDYGLSECPILNTVDTNRIYQLIKSKKNLSIGLKTLALNYLNYNMKKDFQRADWRIRPLFKQMIQYAAIDAQILPYVFLALIRDPRNTATLEKGLAQKKTFRCRNVRNKLVSRDLME